jgi:hypothetical protein
MAPKQGFSRFFPILADTINADTITPLRDSGNPELDSGLPGQDSGFYTPFLKARIPVANLASDEFNAGRFKTE